MKKIITVVALLFVIIGGIFGFKYYQQTYAGKTAYAKVSETVPQKEVTKDSNGKEVKDSYSYEYEFTFVKKDGSVQKMSYELASSNPEPLTPNSYIEAEISETRIVSGPKTVSESEVPKNILEKLQQ